MTEVQEPERVERDLFEELKESLVVLEDHREGKIKLVERTVVPEKLEKSPFEWAD